MTQIVQPDAAQAGLLDQGAEQGTYCAAARRLLRAWRLARHTTA
ncbi:hypothetical protein OG244_18550 [Streptomyces brevispora]|nr:hypothetical protein [Streptomyces brevispora]